jgi:chromate transport protein ChrA
VIAALFQTQVDNPRIQGVIRGIRTIAVAILLGNAVRLLRTVPHDPLSVTLAVCAAAAPLFFGVSAFWTIISCGVIGIISIFLRPGVISDNTGSGPGDKK